MTFLSPLLQVEDTGSKVASAPMVVTRASFPIRRISTQFATVTTPYRLSYSTLSLERRDLVERETLVGDAE